MIMIKIISVPSCNVSLQVKVSVITMLIHAELFSLHLVLILTLIDKFLGFHGGATEMMVFCIVMCLCQHFGGT